jgi:hypothetical protein
MPMLRAPSPEFLFAATIAAALTLFAGAASAAGEEESLELRALAAQSTDHRHAQSLIGLVTGAVLIPTGVVLAARSSDDVGNTLGTGLIVSGSVALLLGALDLLPSNIERMAEEVVPRQEWGTIAERARGQRLVLGVVETALGVASTAFGVTMLVADEGVFGLSRNRQYRMGSISTGAGVPFMALGLRTLLVRSPEETLWEMSPSRPMIAPTVMRGGAGVLLTTTF